jgi:hypothetical protein
VTVRVEIEDHPVTKAEHEFYASFARILEHLKKRALRAELEVIRLREELACRDAQRDKELEYRREQVEFLSSEIADIAEQRRKA